MTEEKKERTKWKEKTKNIIKLMCDMCAGDGGDGDEQ